MPSYRLRITSCGPNKIQVIKVLREASQASLLEAKRATDDPDSAVFCTIREERLERLREEVVGLGAQIEAVQQDLPLLAVRLLDGGPRKIDVIKEVRTLLGCGLKEAKDLVDAAPAEVAVGLHRPEAQIMLQRLERAGAVAELASSTASPPPPRTTPFERTEKMPPKPPPSGGPAPIPY